jgi:hypothetical protein
MRWPGSVSLPPSIGTKSEPLSPVLGSPSRLATPTKPRHRATYLLIHAGSLIRYAAPTASSSSELSAYSPATSFRRLESEPKPLPSCCRSHPAQPPLCSSLRSPCHICRFDRSRAQHRTRNPCSETVFRFCTRPFTNFVNPY